ncbi:MAG: hypothetical protein ACI83B_002537 [Sediminicola sp.]|jgi:hypothetical protein
MKEITKANRLIVNYLLDSTVIVFKFTIFYFVRNIKISTNETKIKKKT